MKFLAEPLAVLFVVQVPLHGEHDRYPRVGNQQRQLLGMQRQEYGAGNLGRIGNRPMEIIRIQPFIKALLQLMRDGFAHRVIEIGRRRTRGCVPV